MPKTYRSGKPPQLDFALEHALNIAGKLPFAVDPDVEDVGTPTSGKPPQVRDFADRAFTWWKKALGHPRFLELIRNHELEHLEPHVEDVAKQLGLDYKRDRQMLLRILAHGRSLRERGVLFKGQVPQRGQLGTPKRRDVAQLRAAALKICSEPNPPRTVDELATRLWENHRDIQKSTLIKYLRPLRLFSKK